MRLRGYIAAAVLTTGCGTVGISHVTQTFNFDFDQATLRPDSMPVLEQVRALFADDATYAAEIGGHTDNQGARDYNLKLSAKRADAVKAWLVGKGIAAGRITTAGYGDTRPLVPNTNDENKARNRRVELRRSGCKD